MAGRKPKPSKLKVLQGTNRPDRANPNEPTPEEKIPSCPKHLNKQAKKEWHRVTKILDANKMITGLDMAALAAYCQMYGRWVEAEENLSKESMVVLSPIGYMMQSPYLSIANKCMEMMKSFLTEFGMTPSSRTRIKTGNTEKRENPMTTFLRKKAK